MSIGMLMAFLSYSNTFSARIFNLVDVAINCKMLDLHLSRLSDIVLEPAELDGGIEPDTSKIVGKIELKNVCYRYGQGEALVIDDASFEFPIGKCVALTGCSGCGKTTLCKIILGLISPTEGSVLVDGIQLSKIGNRAWRSLVGTVMQDDQLLSGSIIDNICFFDQSPDVGRVVLCSTLASIKDDIERMPMGFQTLIGDMGSSLSGGQKQRVLLARALYKNPKLLILDEATSHLDVANEMRVNNAISKFDITRIVIAHRPETIAMADIVLELVDGKIIRRR
jgi:ATP-binding cassette subfamily B protein RaxB